MESIEQIKEIVKEYGIEYKNLIYISNNFHEIKKLGFFSSEKEKLKKKAQEFKKLHTIGFLPWGSFIMLIEKAPLITAANVSKYYDEDLNLDGVIDSQSTNDEMHIGPPSINTLKKSLTIRKIRKYTGYSSLDLSDVTAEVESFFLNQKFGWASEVKPTVVVDKKPDNALIRCFTAKTLLKTWGNSNETAINLIIEKNNDSIEYTCGFTGNEKVLSAKHIGVAVLTGGVSLAGNAASAIKDDKLVKQTMEFIENMMNSQFSKDVANTVNIQHENDIPAQIKKLSTLKDQGILTEEEFTSKKTELLNKM